jgi:hypothetical protein
MELVWDNWKLYSEVPHGFSRNGRGLCLMTHTAVPFKGVSRRLLLVLSLTPFDKFNFLKDRLYV